MIPLSVVATATDRIEWSRVDGVRVLERPATVTIVLPGESLQGAGWLGATGSARAPAMTPGIRPAPPSGGAVRRRPPARSGSVR
jgi:hypothetical protein